MKNSKFKKGQAVLNTLCSTVDAAINEATCYGAVLADEAAARAELWDLPLNYGQVRRGDFPLASYKGRNTRKYFHVVITRLDSGRYELVTYVL